jgi:thimet oligopeptidase
MPRIAALILTLAAIPAAAADSRPPLAPMYDAAGAVKACGQGLAKVRRSVDAMAARKGPGTIFAEWNRLFIDMEEGSNALSLYATVHPDAGVRAAGEDCDQKFTTVNTDLFQNEKLYARLKAAKPSNPRQAKLQRDLLQGFEDSGVSLPPDKRARAKELAEKMEELRQSFERNVRDDPTTVTFTAAEMEGLPEAYLKARKRDASGNYVLRLDAPSYGPFMENAKNEAARERYYRARFNQGGEKNLAILQELFELRQELAHLHGQPTFAHYVLRRKMAANPDNVQRFLAEVKAAVDPIERREVEELRAEKARDLGTEPTATKLNRWDVNYYQERIKRARFDIDQERLRAYFPSEKAVAFSLLIAERMYGLKFKPGIAPVWHPEVRYFEMHDAKTGRYLANVYMDLYPREGKRNGAFAAPLRSASRLVGRTPSAALVANLDRNGLNLREMETLLHELGHVLNEVLSNVEYAPQVLSTVKWDFVEAPSQMFEEWTRREQTLALFKEVCAECPQLTPEQIRKLDAARRYGAATIYARQWMLASFDMELSLKPRPPLEVWKELEAASPLGHIEGTRFPTAFTHIASGYAAGYYGYMWAQVIACDLRSAFGNDLLDTKVAARYREAILGAGNEREETEMVRRFLGRDPNSQAFFAEITGKS